MRLFTGDGVMAGERDCSLVARAVFLALGRSPTTRAARSDANTAYCAGKPSPVVFDLGS